MRRALVEAEERADVLLAESRKQARELTLEAERVATALREKATEEGRARGYAEVLSRFASLNRLEAETDERGLARSVEMARILAERLIGASIAADEATVAALAGQVLSEVRGARQVKLNAHPADVAVLEEHLGPTGVLHGLTVVADATCSRGSFRIATDVGTMDAQIGERLDLLTVTLGETLRRGV